MRSSIKWTWKMDYCRRKRIPPAQQWAWSEAGEAYDLFVKQKTGRRND